MEIIHISFGGPSRNIIVDDKKYLFEDHPNFGPHLLNKDGEPSKKQLSERHPFWNAVSLWYQQGKKFNNDGTCAYVIPEPEVYEHIIGNHYRLVNKKKNSEGK